MGIVIPFPQKMALPAQRLTKAECDALATVMIAKGLDIYVSISNGSKYACVHGYQGEPYYIGREDGVCYLLNYKQLVIVSSPEFDVVQRALELILKTNRKEQLRGKA